MCAVCGDAGDRIGTEKSPGLKETYHKNFDKNPYFFAGVLVFMGIIIVK